MENANQNQKEILERLNNTLVGDELEVEEFTIEELPSTPLALLQGDPSYAQ